MKHRTPECPSCAERYCEGPPVCGLKYIARSPAKEHGGFHQETIAIAKGALRLIYQLRRRCAQQDKYVADAALRLIDAQEKLNELGVRETVSA